MAWAEFEEKSFETSLYQQLRVSQQLVWSPGQVLEGHLGFDYAAVCVDAYFWSLHGLSSPLGGYWLDEMFHRKLWSRRVIKTPLPDFSLNVFLQAKRPYHTKYVAKKLKAAGLKAPYWKMTIQAHQQQLLEALAKNTKDKALVCYASPAFHESAQLYAHTKAGTIVQHTSFPEALLLASHAAWHYDAPGCGGVANADPEFLEAPPLEVQVGRRRERRAETNRTYDAHLKDLGEAVIASVEAGTPASSKISFSCCLARFHLAYRSRCFPITSLLEALWIPDRVAMYKHTQQVVCARVPGLAQ